MLAGFDPPGDPWGAGHRGVDLAGSAGQSVHAALAGTVRFAGLIAGRGVVVVDHGDTRTTYEPVDATVAVGSSVATGRPIGRLAPRRGRTASPAPACTGAGCAARPTSTRSTSSAAVPVRLLPLWRDDPVPGVPRRAGSTGAVPARPAGRCRRCLS